MSSLNPLKNISFAVGTNQDSGQVFVIGNADAPNIVLLCAGYPDDHQVFMPLAHGLATAADAPCLVGITCLPGYSAEHPAAVDGYSFDDMIATIRESVKILRRESTHPEAQLIGIFHDMGVVPGCMYANRTCQEQEQDGDKKKNGSLALDKIVLFDIMGPPHKHCKNKPKVSKETFFHKLVSMSYRAVLAASFGIRRYVSKHLAQAFATVSLGTLYVLGLLPMLEIDKQTLLQERNRRSLDDRSTSPPPRLDRMIYMAFPFYRIFQSMIRGTLPQDFDGYSLPESLAKTPVLFLYGTQKRIMLHDERSRILLESEHEQGGRSNAVAVDGAGHWLYLQQPDRCLSEVTQFIDDKTK